MIMADQLAGHWYSMLSNSSQVGYLGSHKKKLRLPLDFVIMNFDFIHFPEHVHYSIFGSHSTKFAESNYENKSTKCTWIFGNLIFGVILNDSAMLKNKNSSPT